MFCTICGYQITAQVKFCGSCGNPTQRGQSAEETKAAPSPQISPAPNESADTSHAQGTPAESNGLATAALVLGILSALFFEFVFVPIAALVVSAFALSKSTSLANKGQGKTGKGKSIAGLILGGVYLFIWFGWNALGWGPGR